MLEGYYGVVQARAIVMPLNVRLSEPELTSILNHSGAKMLMFEDDFAPMVEKLRTSCPSVKHWVSLDDKTPDADLTYEELLAQGHPERADIFSYDEMRHRRAVLHQRQHRNAQGRHARAPHSIPARAGRRRDL